MSKATHGDARTVDTEEKSKRETAVSANMMDCGEKTTAMWEQTRLWSSCSGEDGVRTKYTIASTT